jgi:hypothetical protein
LKGHIVRSEISRIQEYRADEQAAITVGAKAMISALQKLDLMENDVFSSQTDQEYRELIEFIAELESTHPTTKNRIKRSLVIDNKLMEIEDILVAIDEKSSMGWEKRFLKAYNSDQSLSSLDVSKKLTVETDKKKTLGWGWRKMFE